MSLPNKRERQRIMEQVELNAKQNGKYLNVTIPTYKEFVNDIIQKYPDSKDAVTNILDNPKNIIKEYVKYAHVGVEINNVVDKEWFKTLLVLILKSAKAALNLAYNLVRSVGRYVKERMTNNVIDRLSLGGVVVGISLSLAGLVAGLTACVIMIALSTWLSRVNKKMNAIQVKDEASWWDKIKTFSKQIYDAITGNEPEPLPEELTPPEPDVPNISFTFIKEGMIDEAVGTDVIMGGLFVLFLKAVIAYRLSEELSEKLKYLSALFKPVGLILAFSSILALLGSGAASALA